MPTIEDKALWAKRLKADEGFCLLLSEIQETATSRFLNSAPDQPEAREAAHQLVTAIRAIEQHLEAWEGDELFKKDQHRGND